MPQDMTAPGKRSRIAVTRPRAWLAGFIIAQALYGVTMAPGLLWGDSGEIQLHILLDGWYVNGEIARSHVLFYGIARFLYWLLPFKATLAANLVSAIAGAVTVANLSWLLATLCRTNVAVVCGTALLLVSHTLWQLSASAEVVTLSTALLSAELVLFVKLVETHRLRWLAAMLFANGLGVSNHNFALLMWPVYLVIAMRWWSAFPPRRWRTATIAVGALLLGMVPVLLLCLDDLTARGSVWGTLESFLVGHYGHKVANVGHLPKLFIRSAAMTVMNFPTPLLLLAIPGLFHLRDVARRPTCWLIWGATLIHLLFAARYNVPDQHTFLAPVFLFVAMFTAIGIDRFLSRRRSPALAAVVLALSVSAPLAYALAPPLLRRSAPNISVIPSREVPYRDPLAWFLRPWRVGYDGTVSYAVETLSTLPTDAWLVVDTTLCAPLNYVQVADMLRRDVRLDNRLARQDWFEPVNTEQTRKAKLRADLMFVGSDRREYWPRWLRGWEVRLVRIGHVFRVETINETGLPPTGG